ncbi:SDR family oxidoreductase [Actinopolymorpha pittospori]
MEWKAANEGAAGRGWLDMADSSITVAVTGGSGKVGGQVAHRLAGRGVVQRIVAPRPERAPRLPGAEVAGASYADRHAMQRALDGVDTLFLVSGREASDRVRQHANAVDAAVAAGVERIVYLSFVGAGPKATFTFARDHWHTEEYIRARGVRFTFVRDNMYQAMLPGFVGKDGCLRAPAGTGAVAAVAHDDVADAVTSVLLDEAHQAESYELTGPEALTFAQIAKHLSEVTGRPIQYHPETLEEAYLSRSTYDAHDWEVAGWVTSFQAIATGELAEVTDTVRVLTGHPPMDFRDYLGRCPQTYQHLV